MRRLVLKTTYALGDIVLMTAAVRDLHRCYPGAFLTDVRTPCGTLWNHNPYLCHLDENDPEIETISLDLPLIDWSNRVPYHALEGFIDHLNQQLGLHVRCTEFKGDIHLSAAEKRAQCPVFQLARGPIPFWLIFAGGRHEITVKWWDSGRYQEVVNHFRGRIQFVQAGSASDYHPRLDGTIDLRGRTNLRELLQLVYHCQGVLCGVTGPMHLAAAVEVKPPSKAVRPCVVVAGGREPAHWEAYPGHQFIHTIGSLPCCARGGCWKTRTVPLGDGSLKDQPSELCLNVKGDLPFCMHLISAEEVVRRIETYFDGQALKYLSATQAAAGTKAVQRSAHNPIDHQPLSVGNARYALERFCRTAKPCRGEIKGRGVVICVTALDELTQAWICIKLLRQRRCALPIELWHRDCRERITAIRGELSELAVRCVDLAELGPNGPKLAASESEIAAYALCHSSFQEVLLLAPATAPAVSPEYLFEREEYAQTGMMAWPGAPGRRIEPRGWHLSGLSESQEPPIANAPMLLDKKKCWKALALWSWCHEHSPIYEPHTDGGRHIAHLAFRKAGVPWARGRRGAGRARAYHDCTGKLVFYAQRPDSVNLFLGNPRSGRLAWEEDCQRHLRELREHLSVVIPGPSLFRGNGKVMSAPAAGPQQSVAGPDNGRSKPGLAAPRFTLVTLHDALMAGPGKLTAQTLREYAQQQGYECVCHSRLLDPDRHPSWNKILAVREALARQREGWVMWVDADAMVMNHRIRVESLIPPGRDLVLASDVNGLVAGIFMIRHCEWSLRFLDTICFLGDVERDPDGNGPKWEQNTIKHVLNNFAGFAEHAALLPKRQLNSDLSSFEPGDFILHLGLMTNGNRERVFREALAWVIR